MPDTTNTDGPQDFASIVLGPEGSDDGADFSEGIAATQRGLDQARMAALPTEGDNAAPIAARDVNTDGSFVEPATEAETQTLKPLRVKANSRPRKRRRRRRRSPTSST